MYRTLRANDSSSFIFPGPEIDPEECGAPVMCLFFLLLGCIMMLTAYTTMCKRQITNWITARLSDILLLLSNKRCNLCCWFDISIIWIPLHLELYSQICSSLMRSIPFPICYSKDFSASGNHIFIIKLKKQLNRSRLVVISF